MLATARLSVALATVLFVGLFISVTPTPTDLASSSSPTDEPLDDFNCPQDCRCDVPPHTHTKFLHAKCSSLKGLMGPVRATLPIHSVDLSYLNLPRLSHALDHLHDLTSVDLSHNELHEIGHLGRRIKKLNLRHNRITSAKLVKMPQHVQVLNLQHNDITYLPLELTKLTQLHTLELSHNQINCSCETLEVRNWLQERHVFMEHAVVCSYPAMVKGQSWLQVKQQDICRWEKEHAGFVEDDENEVMLGDQPVEGSGDTEDVDELADSFIPVTGAPTAAKLMSHPAELISDDDAGSGDGMHHAAVLATESSIIQETTTEDDDEGSGSGGGILIVAPNLFINRADEDEPLGGGLDEDTDGDNDSKVEEKSDATESPTQIFGAGFGIFDDGEKPVEEPSVVPTAHHDLGSAIGTEGPDGADNADLKTASVAQKDDTNATYFLLGVVALIVVGLILFVGIKRCKSKSRSNGDAENPRQTELLDMDKKNLGKPKQFNGTEHAPLIGEKTKADMAKPVNGSKPYDSVDMKENGGGQPLLNGNGTSNGNGPNEADVPKGPTPHEYYPISPRYPTPQSPRASKYAQYPQGEKNNNNNNNMEDSYMPASPKAGRYSPVYSPETGRVKIKLTETPRPKTPMLVTRSKSNAGDIITTPVHHGNVDASGVVRGTPIPATGTNGHVNY